MKLNFAEKIESLPKGATLISVDKYRIEFILNGKAVVYFFSEDGKHMLTLKDTHEDISCLKGK